MAEEELKRFTISVAPELDEKLDRVKKEYYYKETQSDMIKELIALGLKTVKEEEGGHKKQ